MKLKSKIAATLAVLALASTANAAYVNGVVGFGLISTLDNSALNLATQVTTWDLAFVSLPTGDFASFLVNGSPALFTAPWSFSSGAVNPLWTAGGFSFNLTSSSVVTQNANFLDVKGTGTVLGNGFFPTPGVWTFTITNAASTAQSSQFNFTASTATTAVPDGGTTVALLGLSFLGLGGVSRFLRRK